ncbi:hypothetical protein L6164_020826 [Bauhinia variegata]|uniref:Uncharacterized protein n=1 Tax=Bauhinia variegata TaxID=167791 RepID=A0ACB9MYB9_BAUVA|nr:hypothetical protein L6164_020826 [Bauhinia variegata]
MSVASEEQIWLQRCGKSCRLRWINYLRPDIKRGTFSLQEEQTIILLHALLGNKWSAIAAQLPMRTDNEIKNYWNTHLKKRLLKMGIDPSTHKPKTATRYEYLSHITQWESVRLQAEARLVRESKMVGTGQDENENQNQVGGSQTARLVVTKIPVEHRPPCLDVLKAWQNPYPSSTNHNTKMHDMYAITLTSTSNLPPTMSSEGVDTKKTTQTEVGEKRKVEREKDMTVAAAVEAFGGALPSPPYENGVDPFVLSNTMTMTQLVYNSIEQNQEMDGDGNLSRLGFEEINTILDTVPYNVNLYLP